MAKPRANRIKIEEGADKSEDSRKCLVKESTVSGQKLAQRKLGGTYQVAGSSSGWRMQEGRSSQVSPTALPQKYCTDFVEIVFSEKFSAKLLQHNIALLI